MEEEGQTPEDRVAPTTCCLGRRAKRGGKRRGTEAVLNYEGRGRVERRG